MPFFSAILERLVLSRLSHRIASANLDELFQSNFKRGHNTETAPLNVTNFCRAADWSQDFILILLDLSEDTADDADIYISCFPFSFIDTVDIIITAYLIMAQ